MASRTMILFFYPIRRLKRNSVRFWIYRSRKIGMSQPSFSAKLRASSWSLEEMVKLCKALHLTQEDCSAILGVK